MKKLLLAALLFAACKQKEEKFPMLYTYQVVPLRDYQVEIVEDSLLLYDGKRFIGTVPFDYSPIDSLICADNE